MRKSSLVLVLASGAALTIAAHAFAGPPPAGAPSVVTPKPPVSPAKGTVPAPGLAWSEFAAAATEISVASIDAWVRDAEVSIGACNNNNLVLAPQTLHNNSPALGSAVRDGLTARGVRPVVAQAVNWALFVSFQGWAAGYSANIPNVFPELTSSTAKECHAPLASRQTTPFRVRLGSSTAEVTGAWIRGEIVRAIGPAIASEPGADAAITAFANQFEWHFNRWREAASISHLTCTASAPSSKTGPKGVGTPEGSPNCSGQVRGSNVLTGPSF
jgi:hypothetical protein